MATNLNVPPFEYISGITNEQFPTVTFTTTHYFVPNEYVSFRVSRAYGMVEINNLRAKVLSIGTYTILIDIDTTFFSVFLYPVSTGQAPPVCVPVASGIEISYNPTVILNDAFDNIEVFT